MKTSSRTKREQAEKSDRWFRKIAELNDVPDITSAISDDDFPEIMPMRKGENRFVVSKKKDRSLTTPAYKRRLAMEQSGNTNFVPFVPFPPDYFAKKEKPQADGTDSTDRSSVESSSVSEGTEMSGDATARPEQSPGPPSDQISSKNNHIGSTYAASSSGNSSQDFNQDHVPNLTESSSTGSASENQCWNRMVREKFREISGQGTGSFGYVRGGKGREVVPSCCPN